MPRVKNYIVPIGSIKLSVKKEFSPSWNHYNESDTEKKMHINLFNIPRMIPCAPL